MIATIVLWVLAGIGAVALLAGLGLYGFAWREAGIARRVDAEMAEREQRAVDAEFARIVEGMSR